VENWVIFLLMALQDLHLSIKGQVQGVGFRDAAAKQAKKLKLVGWVKNNKDGSVEVYVQGEDEPLEVFQEWCDSGPPTATVNMVEILDGGPIDTLTHKDFKIDPK